MSDTTYSEEQRQSTDCPGSPFLQQRTPSPRREFPFFTYFFRCSYQALSIVLLHASFASLSRTAAWVQLIILISTCALGQPSRFLEEWRWTEFTTESGLPSNHVFEIVETKSAMPWAFTESGPAWYDGCIWHQVPFPVTPPLSKPQSFYADDREKIILTYDSTVFIGDTSGFQRMEFDKVYSAAPMDDGRLMLLRDKTNNEPALEIWDYRNLIPVSIPARTGLVSRLHLHRTESGTVWLCTEERLFTWQKGHWVQQLQLNSFPGSWLWRSALAENAKRDGFVFDISPKRSLELLAWNAGGEYVEGQDFMTERVTAGDIAENGTIVLANLAGYYHVRYGGEWSTIRLPQLWGRKNETVKFRENNDLWLCTNRGLFLCRYSSKRWQYLLQETPSPMRSVNDILFTSDSSLWIAADGGVFVFNKDGSRMLITDVLGQHLRAVTGLLEDSQRNIWICSGSHFTGVFRWDGSTWKRVGEGTLLGKAYIHRMRMDRRGRVWLLGLPGPNPSWDQEGPGAFLYDNGTVTQYNVPSNRAYAFDEAPDGSLWFGTHSGISRCKSGEWKHWPLNELFFVERVFTLAMDNQGQVWFSDAKGVVGLIDTNDIPHRITTEDGLLNEQVWEMKVDRKGRLWCTSPTGLSVHCNGVWVHIDEELGMRNDLLWPIVPLENEVYVGSLGGLTILKLTGIDRPAPRLFFDQPLTAENSVQLHWKALTPWGEIPSSLIRTRYRLAGAEWSPWSYSRKAKLENLSPGEYWYEVQSIPLLGNETSHCETVRSRFAISLPLVRNPRFVIPLTLMAVLLLFVAVRSTLQTRRLKQQQLREELRREHEHAERLAEVDRIKSRFFANISHEFRTPLTLVLGPVDQVLSRIKDEWVREKLVMAHRNAEKLHGLINQLLDFSKIEAGTMKLAVSKGDIVSFVKRVVQSFQSWAEQKKQTLRFASDSESIEGYFDADCVEKILNNLISNALKFTPEGGIVDVKITNPKPLTSNRIEISVSDSGIGIAPEHLPRIFDRFYRVDESHRTEGTGIGLALTRELVELHHGSITVESTMGKGSEFTVTLPLESYSADERATAKTAKIEDHSMAAAAEVSEKEHAETESGNVHKTIVLVVEDSADVRAYIRDYLIPEYSALEAHNGVEALEMARATIPDLVVSDIMMPVMDGYELCRELKRDERTSHIPIILLTARSGMENKIEGLETGADDYLTKPFDAKELLVRIRNLIEGRKKLREKFSKAIPLKPGEVAVTSIDDIFLHKAIDVVEKFMGDEHFDVEKFSYEMALSRMQLHRKLRALTNQSAIEFVKRLRLLRAHELLTKNAGTVSEIAYQTGFRSLAHFTHCYREQFGCTPRETRECNEKPA